MIIGVECELPFSWCQDCSKRDLTKNEMIADGEVLESQTICENAPICEACERARKERQPGKHGSWVWEMYQYTPHCSICGGDGLRGPANGPRFKFCPHCGAEMETRDG